MQGYRPQMFLRTADITVSLTFPENITDANEKMVMPGDHVEMVLDLVHDVATEVGDRFTLREGGRTSECHPSHIVVTTLNKFCSWYGYCYQGR